MINSFFLKAVARKPYKAWGGGVVCTTHARMERTADQASAAEWQRFLEVLSDHEEGLSEDIELRVPLNDIINSDWVAKAGGVLAARAGRMQTWTKIMADDVFQHRFFKAELCFTMATTPGMTPGAAFDALEAQYMHLNAYASENEHTAFLFERIHQLRWALYASCTALNTLTLKEANEIVRNVWLAGVLNPPSTVATHLEDKLKPEDAKLLIAGKFQKKYTAVERLLDQGKFKEAKKKFAATLIAMVTEMTAVNAIIWDHGAIGHL